MGIKQSIAQRINRAFEHIGKHRVRQELLAMSDRSLQDIGFSRELLLKGIEAWPWRVEETSTAKIIEPAFGKDKTESTNYAQDLPNVA